MGDKKKKKKEKMENKPVKSKKSSSVFPRLLCCGMMPAVTSANQPVANQPPESEVDQLLSALDQLGSGDNASDLDLDLAFVRDLLQSNDFQSLLKVHEKVSTPETAECKPLAESAVALADEVNECIEEVDTAEAEELLNLLSQPHLKGLLLAHDQVATKDFGPHLPDIPHEVDEDEESVKIVRLVKGSTEPLGATIQMVEETGVIKIARVMHGGAADRSGLIHIGDEVHEVNGVQVRGKPPDEVVNILSTTVGPITLKLVPGDLENGLYRESKMRVRAFFDYNPEEDKMTPCPEAGLAFRRGDVLHIVNLDDPYWWQAHKEGDKNMRAGIIPGRQLQERKEALKQKANLNDTSNKENKDNSKDNKNHKGKVSPKLNKKAKKTKKIMYYAQQNEDFDGEEIFTYEEVERYYPKTGQYRPIVLIGAPGVGRNELKKRLMASESEHYRTTIPHTSRAKKPGEVDGEEYFFIPRQEMEKDIQNKKFVEFGEYKGNLYGTSMEQIKSIINSGKVCVMCPHPQALKLLRVPDVKPYVVYVKPPSLERLKETRVSNSSTPLITDGNRRHFTEEELQEMLQVSAKLEARYDHYFDQIIVNDELQKAINELCLVAHRLETESQWVCATWMR